MYSLRDAEEAWIGVVQLHIELKRDMSDSSDRVFGEFVEISRGYVFEGGFPVHMGERYHPGRPKSPDGEKYEFVNVLWIEWEEGIAYRKAYGRVMKSAWETQELELIDLVLG
jgi:hypothetical protein